MLKRILFTIFLMVVSTSISGCAKLSNAHELAITIGKEKIDIINVAESKGNTKDIFKPAFQKDVSKEIKYVKIGDKVILDFGSSTPNKMTIQEIFLNTNGEYLYTTDGTITEISFNQENGKYSFKIEKSLISALSSTSYEGKTDLRGYKITALHKKDKKIYALVIKTDSY